MAERRGAVVVVGSVHMDLIAHADRLPGPGESVAGGVFAMGPGGKAGNQAAQLARCGVPTAIVTRLGDDPFGRELRATLDRAGIDTRYVAVDRQRPTGASTIFAAAGDYCSIIAPGAAAALTDADIQAVVPALSRAAALLLQLELPVDRALLAAELAANHGVRVVLNASPMPASATRDIHRLLAMTDLLVVNRVEATRLLGRDTVDDDGATVVTALARRFGIAEVVVTLGADGLAAVANGQTWRQPAFPADVVDAVGAGDACLGALVAAEIAGLPVGAALRRGAAAGAITVGRAGGLRSLPSRAEIDDHLAERPAVALPRRDP